jgi:hypothetical protein
MVSSLAFQHPETRHAQRNSSTTLPASSDVERLLAILPLA